MVEFIKKILRAILKNKPLKLPDGYVDHSQFKQQIDRYRCLGTKIGKKVRLLGRIDGVNPNLISIGDYSVIGAESALLSHCPVKGAQPCTVGNFVYISFGALILPGVTVGDQSIVGAGAVVTKDVPAGTIVAGNPARIIRVLADEEMERIRETLLNDKIFGRDDVCQ